MIATCNERGGSEQRKSNGKTRNTIEKSECIVRTESIFSMQKSTYTF